MVSRKAGISPDHQAGANRHPSAKAKARLGQPPDQLLEIPVAMGIFRPNNRTSLRKQASCGMIVASCHPLKGPLPCHPNPTPTNPSPQPVHRLPPQPTGSCLPTRCRPSPVGKLWNAGWNLAWPISRRICPDSKPGIRCNEPAEGSGRCRKWPAAPRSSSVASRRLAWMKARLATACLDIRSQQPRPRKRRP